MKRSSGPLKVGIVGAGKMGGALLHYRGFRQHGFDVAAIYDKDPRKIGARSNGLVVRDIKLLEADLRKDPTDIAILVTPAEAAQEVADRLVHAGVKAILTPGHAPWHQSLLVSLKNDGNILLCSDAIYCQDNLDHEAWGGQAEPEVARESAQKLLQIADEKDAFMVYGHDPDQWRRLRKVPAYYA